MQIQKPLLSRPLSWGQWDHHQHQYPHLKWHRNASVSLRNSGEASAPLLTRLGLSENLSSPSLLERMSSPVRNAMTLSERISGCSTSSPMAMPSLELGEKPTTLKRKRTPERCQGISEQRHRGRQMSRRRGKNKTRMTSRGPSESRCQTVNLETASKERSSYSRSSPGISK